MKKVLLPGILGGLLVFIWSAIAHMALPIGEMGLKTLPNNEDKLLTAMKENIQQPGLYLMPGFDMSKKPTDAEMNAFNAKYETGPTAFLVYHPTGEKAMSPGQLLRQLLFDVLGGLIAAFIISMTLASVSMRAAIVTLMGLFSWITVNLPHWNWYRFPAAFSIGEGLDQVVGWLLGGLLIAWLVQRAEKKAAL
jgi:hypothetical protein